MYRVNGQTFLNQIKISMLVAIADRFRRVVRPTKARWGHLSQKWAAEALDQKSHDGGGLLWDIQQVQVTTHQDPAEPGSGLRRDCDGQPFHHCYEFGPMMGDLPKVDKPCSRCMRTHLEAPTMPNGGSITVQQPIMSPQTNPGPAPVLDK